MTQGEIRAPRCGPCSPGRTGTLTPPPRGRSGWRACIGVPILIVTPPPRSLGTVARASRLLDVLARGHLIEPTRPGRYAMHDLLRGYARELAGSHHGEQERHRALTRLFDYYLHTVAAAISVVHPAGHTALGAPRLAARGRQQADAVAAIVPRLIRSPAARVGWTPNGLACSPPSGTWQKTAGHAKPTGWPMR